MRTGLQKLFMARVCVALLVGMGCESIVVACCALTPSATFGQGVSLETVLKDVPESLAADRDKFARTLKTFRAREDSLISRTEQELDRLAVQLKNDRSINDQQRLAFSLQIDRTRNWLRNGTSLGELGCTVKIIIDSSRKAHSLRSPVERAAHSLSKKLRAEDVNVAEKFDRAVFLLGGVFNGHTVMVPGMVFNGERIPAGAMQGATMRFTFGTKDGGLGSAKVETGMQFLGHPHHALSWQIEGLAFRATTGETVRPENRLDSLLQYDGMFIGDVIFGTYSGKDSRGQYVKGSFRVKLKS